MLREVKIEKKARRPSGLILSKKPYVTDRADVIGVRLWILYIHHYCSVDCV